MNRLERFDTKYTPEPNSGCWLWFGAIVGPQGYGTFWNGKRMVLAHHFAYEAYVGIVPTGLNCLHCCDTPSCVNPGHLFLGTHIHNAADRDTKGRNYNASKTHCRRGHEFTNENTRIYVKSDGSIQRACKECHRMHMRNYYHRGL